MNEAQNALLHLQCMLQDPLVASIAPSTDKVAETIASYVSFREARLILEYGAGTGEVTRHFAAQIHPHTKLIAIERNRALWKRLKKNTLHEHIEPVLGDAVEFSGNLPQYEHNVDVVISGIPLTALPPDKVADLFCNTRKLLKPSGVFILYQMFLPPLYTCKKTREELARHFVEIAVDDVIGNLPPLRVIVNIPRYQSVSGTTIKRS